MPTLSYRRPGLQIGPDNPASPQQIRDLQRDLRRLGYLRRGIDGVFGPGTRAAVMALQYDLLHEAPRNARTDGPPPVRIVDYNRGRVAGVTGTVDEAVAACISEMLDDPRFPKLPSSADPVADNIRVAVQIRALSPTLVPTPFLVAVLQQESGLAHFCEPRNGDEDNFIVVGLDHNGPEPYVITSRGYGIGQYTLFHHPPRPEEVQEVMLDPEGNVRRAVQLLREKLDGFVAGPVSRADDRIAEHGAGPPSVCRYDPLDLRYLRDCRGCASAAGTRAIRPGLPLYPGSHGTWEPTPAHPSADYAAVPIREGFGCDWPYAVRRYNGSGLDSFHYQAQVLAGVAAPPTALPPPA